ncbi:MAG TPA: hypothetical protein VFS30_07245 [Dehalococcoidia bacterium]|nr:hypothetical protein [Dehalococcoidia bacterium]
MQDDTLFDSKRNELLERLQALEGPQASGSLAELAYRRAREALEKALDEARTIRLQAIDDARNHRERELTALAESLSNFRLAAERQIEELLREAELEAERRRDEARDEARQVIERATAESTSMRAEAAAIRAAADERAREVESLEADFDELIEQIGKRLGMQKPKKPWFRKERYTQ